MKKLFESVIEALGKIQVSGKENLNLLLGCIITLEKLAEACKTKVEENPLEGATAYECNLERENNPGETDCSAGSDRGTDGCD